MRKRNLSVYDMQQELAAAGHTISVNSLTVLLREEGVTFQRLKTWKTSKDPDYAVKKGRVEHLYAIADGEVIPDAGEPEVISAGEAALMRSRSARFSASRE